MSLFLSLFLPLSLFSVLVYASDFVERQEQPEGFLLHKASLLMISVMLITSNAAHCVFLTRDLLENVIKEIEADNKSLPFFKYNFSPPTFFIPYALNFFLILPFFALQEDNMCIHKVLNRVHTICQHNSPACYV